MKYLSGSIWRCVLSIAALGVLAGKVQGAEQDPNRPVPIVSWLQAGLLNSISQDGKKNLFTCTQPDYTQRPYSKTDFFVLELSNMAASKLWTSNWSGVAHYWSPDGRELLCV